MPLCPKRELVNTQTLLEAIDATELTYKATALVAWEICTVSNTEDVAQFMYLGGPLPPQASAKKTPPIEDKRPEKKYWQFVKKEMHAFLCTDDKRYRELWMQLTLCRKNQLQLLSVLLPVFLVKALARQPPSSLASLPFTSMRQLNLEKRRIAAMSHKVRHNMALKPTRFHFAPAVCLSLS